MEFVPKRRVALDIGAHVGLWSLALSSYFSAVYAFEPVFGELLRANLTNSCNVRVSEVALGNVNGVVGMDIVTENSGNTRVCTTVSGPTEIVNMHRFDDVAASLGIVHSDFIKIDVEGYEHDVILGAENFIKSCKPVMVVEQKPGNSERYDRPQGSAVELLKSWGAREAWSMSGDHCMRWK